MVVEFSWPIFGVLIPCGIIAFIGYGFTFAIQLPREMDGVALHQALLTMIWISYALAVFKSPGRPPKSFKPAPGEMRRWCTKCNAYKPERSHHCRQCKTCVLKMDHHCPWTMNCVGHENMPHFIRFLVWVVVGTGITLTKLCSVAAEFYQDRHLPAYLISKRELIFTVILIPLDFFVLFTVSILLIRVLWNILEGKTQIESWEDERVKSLVRRKLVKKVDFPYDIDPFTNLTNAWGNPLTWFFPLGSAPGDGLRFEKNEALDSGDVWPPDHIDQDAPSTQGISTGNSSSSSEPITLGYMRARKRGYDTDFYKRDQWQNYEGEKISDFGVDLDAEIHRSLLDKYAILDGKHEREHSDMESSDEDTPVGLLHRKG